MVQPRTKGRGELDAELIVEAALRLLRRDGIHKLTMRALASELGVSPMAIYHHVPSKEALLDRVRERGSALVLVSDAGSAGGSALAAEGALTEARIVEEGLAMLREAGANSLSMRGLARRLGATPMALYNHVSNREDLIDRLRDAVLARVPTPAPSAEHWRAQIRDYTIAAVSALAEHPGLLRAGTARKPSPSERRLMAYGISVLLEAGFEPPVAALALTAYQSQGFGFAMFAEQMGTQKKGPRKRKRAPASRAHEAIVDTARHLQMLDFDAALAYSIETLLDGLQAQLDRQKHTRQQPGTKKPNRQKRKKSG